MNSLYDPRLHLTKDMFSNFVSCNLTDNIERHLMFIYNLAGEQLEVDPS